MKKILLVGPVDKRPLAYPLIKLLTIVGKCLIVTDDSNFRRFADDCEREFNLGNSDFRIKNDVNKYIEDEFEKDLGDHDFVLFITTNVIVENTDQIIYTRSLNKAILSNSSLDKLEEQENVKEIYMTPNKTRKKGINLFLLKKHSFRYVWECEEYKMFTPCNDSKGISAVSTLFSDLLGMKSSQISKVIRRKG